MSDAAPSIQRTAWLEVFILWFAGISAAMQFAKFSLSYNELLDYYQAGPTLTGASISVVGVMGLIFGVTAGIMASRIGYRRVLIGALCIGSVMSLIQSFLPPFELIIVTRVLEGLSQLGVVVAAPTMIAKISAPQHRSIVMGIWGTFFGVAFAISGWAGKAILEHYDLSGLFLSHAIFIGAMAITLWFMLEKNEERFGTPQSDDGESYLEKMVKVYRSPRIMLPGLIFLFYTCTFVSLLTYIPNFIEGSTLQNTMRVVLPLMSTAGTFLAGTLSQYFFRPQRVASLAYAGLAIGALALTQVADQPIIFSIVTAQMILFAGMVPGAALSSIPRLAHDSHEQANGYGLIAQFGNLGATLGPPSFATMIAAFGIYGLVGLVLVICTLGSIFALLAAGLEKRSTFQH